MSKQIVLGWGFSALALGAQAANVELAFDTLPSTQGWTYVAVGNAVAETSIFSLVEVDGMDALRQNSVGVGTASGGSNRYNFPGAVEDGVPFTLAVRAQLVRQELTNTNYFGFAFGGFTDTHTFGVGLGRDAANQGVLQLQSSTTQTFAADVFGVHSYELRGTTGAATYSLFIDGSFVASVPYRAGDFDELSNHLYVGDATGGQNAEAYVFAYEFAQAVPEPRTYAMLLAGLGLMGFVARRRKKGLATA